MINRIVIALYSICLISGVCSAQIASAVQTNENIAVTARVCGDSITIRWAPKNFDVWKAGLKNGFVLDRYTILRNGVEIEPERKILTPAILRPAPLDEWQTLVVKDKYAAIAAQAIYGDDFSVNIGETDAVTIVNKVAENEQRFAFALFSADMSPPTARKSALWFSDVHFNPNEKYLYRIRIPNDSLNSKGSIFIGGMDSVDFPRPRNFTGSTNEHIVNLQWSQQDFPFYTWYKIERSTDSINFVDVVDVPSLTLAPTSSLETKYNYAVDSIQTSRKYFYRVRGVTPFGETGPASNTISLLSIPTSFKAPFISSATSMDNATVSISWEFEQDEKLLRGFIIERGPTDNGPFQSLTLQGPLRPNVRNFIDLNPQSINYYKVAALSIDNVKMMSASYLVTLIDSVAPSCPENLKGKIDESGAVFISWSENIEDDLFGYRIYRSNYVSEEPFQITSEPLDTNFFSERINTKTLNRFVYYSVVAVDRNQNQSSRSKIIQLQVPDRIPPAAPILLPPQIDSTSVTIKWIKSSSDDVVQYDVYRALEGSDQWQRQKIVLTTNDSIVTYRDTELGVRLKYKYTVVAIDSTKNESEKASPVKARIFLATLSPEVKWRNHQLFPDSKTVRLEWEGRNGVKVFRIYKALGEERFFLYKSVRGNTREFIDKLNSGVINSYKIMAEFSDGGKSRLSEILKLEF